MWKFHEIKEQQHIQEYCSYGRFIQRAFQSGGGCGCLCYFGLQSNRKIRLKLMLVGQVNKRRKMVFFFWLRGRVVCMYRTWPGSASVFVDVDVVVIVGLSLTEAGLGE